jgi:hypothetical protein
MDSLEDLKLKLTAFSFKAVGGKIIQGEMPKPRESGKPPGPCTRLDELNPNHHTHKFLTGRGHDPVKLGREFGLSYCFASSMSFANGRIIIPVVQNEKLKGWQARYVDDSGGGDCSYIYHCGQCGQFTKFPPEGQKAPHFVDCPICKLECMKLPKYFSEPGWSKSESLLNYDMARHFPFVVIMEGPMDVFRLGHPTAGQDVPGPGVCLFGHHLSSMQKKMIFETWYHGSVIVLLDGDAYKEGTNTLTELKGNFRGGEAAILLPDDRDPGDCDHNLLWQHIFEKAKKAGLTLGI